MTAPAKLHPLAAAAIEGTEIRRGPGRPTGEVPLPSSVRLDTRPEWPDDVQNEPLHNDYTHPVKPRAKEQAWHRLVIYLKAQGKSNIEIAEQMDCSPVTVGQILAEPWAKLRLAQELVDGGKDLVSEAVRSAALDSVQTLIEVRDCPGEKGATRIAAANSLLDRFLGKPQQKVEVSTAKLPDDIQAIEREVIELRERQAKIVELHSGVAPTGEPASSPTTTTSAAVLRPV